MRKNKGQRPPPGGKRKHGGQPENASAVSHGVASLRSWQKAAREKALAIRQEAISQIDPLAVEPVARGLWESVAEVQAVIDLLNSMFEKLADEGALTVEAHKEWEDRVLRATRTLVALRQVQVNLSTRENVLALIRSRTEGMTPEDVEQEVIDTLLLNPKTKETIRKMLKDK